MRSNDEAKLVLLGQHSDFGPQNVKEFWVSVVNAVRKSHVVSEARRPLFASARTACAFLQGHLEHWHACPLTLADDVRPFAHLLVAGDRLQNRGVGR